MFCLWTLIFLSRTLHLLAYFPSHRPTPTGLDQVHGTRAVAYRPL